MLKSTQRKDLLLWLEGENRVDSVHVRSALWKRFQRLSFLYILPLFLIYVVIRAVRGFWLNKMEDVRFSREIGVVENLARVLPDKKVWDKSQKLVNNPYDVLKRIDAENTRVTRVRKTFGRKYYNRSRRIRVLNSMHLARKTVSLNILFTSAYVVRVVERAFFLMLLLATNYHYWSGKQQRQLDDNNDRGGINWPSSTCQSCLLNSHHLI